MSQGSNCQVVLPPQPEDGGAQNPRGLYESEDMFIRNSRWLNLTTSGSQYLCKNIPTQWLMLKKRPLFRGKKSLIFLQGSSENRVSGCKCPSHAHGGQQADKLPCEKSRELRTFDTGSTARETHFDARYLRCLQMLQGCLWIVWKWNSFYIACNSMLKMITKWKHLNLTSLTSIS